MKTLNPSDFLRERLGPENFMRFPQGYTHNELFLIMEAYHAQFTQPVEQLREALEKIKELSTGRISKYAYEIDKIVNDALSSANTQQPAPVKAGEQELSGIKLIEAERQRQIDVEGYDINRDKEFYGNGELMGAAGSYLANALSKAYFDRKVVQPFARFQVRDVVETRFGTSTPSQKFTDAWPWDEKYDKRSKHDVLRSLIISGALIAAEIDRLQALANASNKLKEEE